MLITRETIEVQTRHLTFSERLARSHIPYPTITIEKMFEAAQRHAAYLKTVSPRDYEMHVFEDGSVLFRSARGSETRFSLAQIQAKSSDFWMSPQRELWQHVFAMWA